MLVRHIGHAGVAIDVAGHHVVCDPWWNGPALAGQWHPFPRPRPQPADTTGVDVVFLSNGHEDHLHVPTLRLVRRDALVVLPRWRDPGLRDFVRSLGFRRVIELGHGKRRQVLPGLAATAYVLRDDSILVLEGGNRTLVNANDALVAVPQPIVDDLCETLRRRHARPDILIAQCAGSNWLAHGIQITDDVGLDLDAVELAGLDRFAAVVQRLEARVALPLVPGFLALDDPLRSRRGARAEAGAVCAALARAGAGDVVVHGLAPGDRVVDSTLHPASRPTAEPTSERRVRRTAALATRRAQLAAEPARLTALLVAMQANAARRCARLLRDTGPLACRIDLRDVAELSFLVEATARRAQVSRCERSRLAPLVLSTRLEVLEALACRDCGDEAIRLGGGATLRLRRRDLPLAEPLVALLGRRALPPTAGESALAWLRDPRRAFEAWRRDHHVRHLARRLAAAAIGSIQSERTAVTDARQPTARASTR